MAEKKKMSFDELVGEFETEFVDVETPKGIVTLGSVNSADMIKWLADNESNDRNTYSGLRLVVLSMINPDGTRVGDGLPENERQAAIEEATIRLTKRSAGANTNLAKEALILNKVRSRAKLEAGLKNESSEVETSASPSDSPAT